VIGLRSSREAEAPVAEAPGSPLTLGDPSPGRRQGSRALPEPEHVVRAAMVRFMLSSALALVLVAGISLYWCSHVALDEALRRAESTGTGIATRIIAPKITAKLRQGDPQAMQDLDDAVHARMADGSIYRIKVWTPEATGKTAKVLYSDETPLIDKSYPIEPKDQALFGTNNASAVLSHLDRKENTFEAAQGKLVEVYAGFEGADHKPLLFEAYFPAQPVERTARVLQRQLLPLSLGSLGLLLLLLLPLAVSLARRTERAQLERNRMLSTSIAASDIERRRIARDLHDGVVQDLAGLGYALTALADGLPTESSCEPAREGTRRAISILRRDVDALRTLVTDIYPPELEQGQLVPAISAMLRTVGRDGPRTSLTAPSNLDVDLSADASVLLYRVVREAVRNAVKHARASAINVRLAIEDGWVTVEVADDGVGITAGAAPGHLGLRLLADTVHDAGGRFGVESAEGAGVLVRASLPLA
jgi:two-component system NarL family sensor kinase